jgi:hypothetical protein
MCRAELFGLAGEYRLALASVDEAEGGCKGLGTDVHAETLLRERNRYTILADAGEKPSGLDQPVFASPRFWAPFVLFGDWR